MKKFAPTMILFLVAFIGTYLGLCYLIPGLRIKLEAGAVTYFFASIRHMAWFKSLISLAVGFLLAGGYALAANRK